MVASRPDCVAIDELLPAYAMDALDEGDRALVESHLATCDRHVEQLASFNAIAVRFSDLAPEMDPPPGLRDRVLAIPNGSVDVVPEIESIPAPTPIVLAERRRPSWLPYTLAAAFAALALFMGTWNIVLMNQDGESLRVANAEHDGITTQVMFMPSRQVMVVEIHGLPAPPAGHDYQMWVIPPGGTPEPAGLISLVDGSSLTTMTGSLDDGWTIAITVEPAGGSSQPTTEPVGAVTF